MTSRKTTGVLVFLIPLGLVSGLQWTLTRRFAGNELATNKIR